MRRTQHGAGDDGFLDLGRTFLILRRWWWLVVACMVFAAVPAFLYTSARADTYEATDTLVIVHPGAAAVEQVAVDQALAAKHAVRATTLPFLTGVAAGLPFETTAEALRGQVTVVPDLTLGQVLVSARDRDPSRAVLIADGVASHLVEVAASGADAVGPRPGDTSRILEAAIASMVAAQAEVQRLSGDTTRTASEQAALDRAWERLAMFGDLVTTYRGFEGTEGPTLEVLQPAVMPTAPVAPRPLLTAILAAFIGALGALGVIALLEYAKQRVLDARDASEVTGLPVLATIGASSGGRPPGQRLAMLGDPRSGEADSYRRLRAELGLVAPGPLSRLLVTAATARKSKSITACNIALAFAQAGRATLLVEADLRNRGIRRELSLPDSRGLSDLLTDTSTPLGELVQRVPNTSLDVMTAGPTQVDPAALYEQGRLAAALDVLSMGWDLVILDGPCIGSGPEAMLIARETNGVVLVIDTRTGAIDSTRRAADLLRQVPASVLGAVVHGT